MINEFLETQTGSRVTIDSALMPPGNTYTFRIQMKNSYQAVAPESGPKDFVVEKLNTAAPLVVIAGSAARAVDYKVFNWRGKNRTSNSST